QSVSVTATRNPPIETTLLISLPAASPTARRTLPPVGVRMKSHLAMPGIVRTYTAIEQRDACNRRARFSFQVELCSLDDGGEETYGQIVPTRASRNTGELVRGGTTGA